MKFFSQLKEAIFERVAGDKPGTIQGQFWFNTVSGQPKINDGTVVKTFIVTDNEQLVPLGDQATNGSWRILVVGAEMQFQRRESSVWVTKGAYA